MPITSTSTWNNFGQVGNSTCVCPDSGYGSTTCVSCVKNPYQGTLKATDFETQNVSSVDRSIGALQLAGDDAVYKSVPTTQVLAGDLNLPSSIGNVNVGAELGLVITQANGNTASLLTKVSKTETDTQNMNGSLKITSTTPSLELKNTLANPSSGTIRFTDQLDSPKATIKLKSDGGIEVLNNTDILFRIIPPTLNTNIFTNFSVNNYTQPDTNIYMTADNGALNHYYETATSRYVHQVVDTTKSFGLGNDVKGTIYQYDYNNDTFNFEKKVYVGGDLKLNANILDSADNQSYILKKGSGNNSYNMGPSTFTGSAANTISIGAFCGKSNDTFGDSVYIGYQCGNSGVKSAVGNTCIGVSAGSFITTGGNTIIGRRAYNQGGGGNCTVVGNAAGSAATGANNTFIGINAGLYGSGSHNTFIGINAGNVAGGGIGSFNTFVGGSSSGNLTFNNQLSLGYQATTTAANQCVIGNTLLLQFQSNGFRDLDVITDNILAIGKTLASKVEIGKVGAITEIKGNLTVPSINTLTPVGGKYSQTTNKTVANIVDETTLINTGVGSLIFGANTFAVGDTYNIHMSGKIRTSGSHDLTLRIKFVGTTTTIIPKILTVNAGADTPIELDFRFTIPTIGSALVGSLKHRGVVNVDDTLFSITQINPILFNTTISRTLDITAQWDVADANNTITAEIITINKIY